MCPNCILNQTGLCGGVYVAFAVCGIFFVAALLALWWAKGSGQFDDIEASKFEMLEDIEGGAVASRARKASGKARARG